MNKIPTYDVPDTIKVVKNIVQVKRWIYNEKLNFSKSGVYNCLIGKNKTSHGYKWKKIDK